MPVENELVYIVRLTAEGEQEVVRAARVIDETGQSVDKVEKKFGSYGSALGGAGKQSKKFDKSTRSANVALLDLTRIAQDAPYGIRGIANNLEQAASSAGNAYQQFGSFKGLVGGLTSSLTGAGGLVLGVTALTLVLQGAENGLFSFGGEVKDFAADSEALISKLEEINDKLNELQGYTSESFFDTGTEEKDIERFEEALKKAKKRKEDLEELTNTDPVDLQSGDFRGFIRNNRVEAIQKEYDVSKEYAKWLKEQAGKLLFERDTGVPGVRLPKEARENLKEYTSDIEYFKDKIDELNDSIDQKGRAKIYFPTANEQRKSGQAVKVLEEKRQELAEQTNTKLVQLEAERVAEIKKIDEQQGKYEDLNDTQRLEAKKLVNQKYAAQETDIRKAQAEKQAAIAADKAATLKKADQFLAKQQLQIASASGDKQRSIELQKQQDIADIKDRFADDEARRQEALDNLDAIYAAKATARAEKARQKEARERAKSLEQERSNREKFDRQGLNLQVANAPKNDQPYLQLYNNTLDQINKVKQLREQNIISKEQMESRITAIEQQYSDRRKRISQSEADRKAQLAQQEEAIRRSAQLETISAFSNQLSASFQQSKAVAVATGTANAILAGINTAKTVSEFAPPPIPQIAGAAMAALQLSQVAKIRSTNLNGSGSASSSGRSVGYRGFDFGGDQVRNPAADRVRSGAPEGSGSNGSGGQKETREITIKDGFGNIVARGQEEIERKGGSNYLRGGS